jgi:hypothetical protein
MPPRRRLDGLDILDDVVDNAIGSLFDRGAEFVQRVRDQQPRPLPGVLYVCILCKQQKPCEMAKANAKPGDEGYGFGYCKECLDFSWQAAQEKMAYLARQQARARAGGGVPPGPTPPPRRPPWDVLEISADASEEEIKKAYRRVAALWHPDRVPAGSPDGEKERYRAKFEEATSARDAMLAVRQVRT